MSLLTRKQRKNIPIYLALIIIVIFIDFPFFQMFSMSFKSKMEIYESLDLLPRKISFENISYIWNKTGFALSVYNSAVVSLTSMFCCIIVAVIAGYALSRFRGKTFSVFSVFLLMLQMFPLILLLIPMFIIFSRLRLVDTLFSVVVAYTTRNLAFSIWMIKGFMDSIPFDLEEAAMIDGCNQFQALLRIIIPISMPGISTVGIFAFINSWGEFMLASILVRSESNNTISLGLRKFMLEFSVDWPLLMTASTMATIPTLFFLVFAQKYLIRGMAAGAVKG